jgi:hypothetical protein
MSELKHPKPHLSGDLTVCRVLSGLENKGYNRQYSYTTIWKALTPKAFEQFLWVALHPDYQVLLCYEFKTEAERLAYEHGNFDLPDPERYGHVETITLTQEELDNYATNTAFPMMWGVDNRSHVPLI